MIRKTRTWTTLAVLTSAITACIAGAPAVASPGDLDAASFGSTGKVITSVGSFDDHANALALQADGKIVVAGYCANGNNDFCLVRYNTNGGLDPSFGNAGKVMTPIRNAQDYATALAVQPDGKIVAAGFCDNGTTYVFCLARYNTNGSFDSSFGSAGTVTTLIGIANDQVTALALQPDGKIVVAGFCHNGSTHVFCLARYNTSGSLDPGFGNAGKVVTAIGSSEDYAAALALQSDGKLVAAGYCLNGSIYAFCLVRYHANGNPDSSFGNAGKVTTVIGGTEDRANALALQPDGKIVAAGACTASFYSDFCLARYLANGDPDPSFGNAGIVTSAIGSKTDVAIGLASQPDGKIVALGYCFNDTNADFCLARYHADGSLDTSFGTAGKVITSISSNSNFAYYASALALQPDGKIVAAGYCYNGTKYDFCLARYEGGSFGYQNCKPDVDGDGHFLANTDALIYTRVALGLTGPAVINGISFTANATRNTWPLIRDYLVSQCGLSLAP